MKSCNCKNKCKVTGEDLIFCHNYWTRFGKRELKYCKRHSATVFHFNDKCIFCMFEDGILEDVMKKALFDDENIKIFLRRIEIVNNRNKKVDLSLVKNKLEKINDKIKNKRRR